MYIYNPILKFVISLIKSLAGPKFYVGFTPNEGENVIALFCYENVTTDRTANLQLGLFTDVEIGETITEALIVEPTGTGYARITLVDATWVITADTAAFPLQTFTTGAGGWTPQVQGYFINTNGVTQRLMHVEYDSFQGDASLTRVTTTATCTTLVAHGFANSDEINVRNAAGTQYNGIQTISNVSGSAFDYTVAGSPVTPDGNNGAIRVNRCYTMNENDTYDVTPNITVA